MVENERYSVDGHGTITVHFIDSIRTLPKRRLRGITWWVNQRRVGEPSWDRLDDEGAYLDGRDGTCQEVQLHCNG